MELSMNIAHDNDRGGGWRVIVGARAKGVYSDAIGFLVKHLGGDEDERVEDFDGENGR